MIINTLQDFKRDGILCLPVIKSAAIIDFASCTPTIVGKELLEDQIHYGQVREKTFDLLNFPEDSDSRGNEVRRDATILVKSTGTVQSLSGIQNRSSYVMIVSGN